VKETLHPFLFHKWSKFLFQQETVINVIDVVFQKHLRRCMTKIRSATGELVDLELVPGPFGVVDRHEVFEVVWCVLVDHQMLVHGVGTAL
jgi:hypothetical protein